jgi:penicillin-binding protein 2
MLDSSNIPAFDTDQFEGRLERPISTVALYSTGFVFIVLACVFIVQAWNLQITHGEEYRTRSEKNLLRPVPIFAGRGVLEDRNGKLLAWNAPAPTTTATSSDESVATRQYATSTGLAHVIGYVKYPSKDKNGFYYQDDFEGVAGAEKYFDADLQGNNGSRLVEVDARGVVVSENVVRPPVQGKSVKLSIDTRVQSALYSNIKDILSRAHFDGGAAVILDVHTGEIIALTSYPEYSPQVMSDRTDSDRIRALLTDKELPFLNRAVDGLYAPGSTVKPYVALGVLTEKVIDPETILYTTGSISIPNPYDPTKSTVFKDWRNNGALDLRKALSVSSDAYFYIVGGGYKDQRGLGIANIDKYVSMFGLGSRIPDSFVQGKAGTVPTPEWKKATFNEDWYLGNTYHTSIGQYGFQVTPMQMARAVAAIANSGLLLIPTIIKDDGPHIERFIDAIPQKNFEIVREGMRMAVTTGTSPVLKVPYVSIASKSGTAELGVAKDHINSWITGFWPYENPKYAFAVMLEKGSIHNTIGASTAMRQQLDWMNEHTPEYFKP